MLFITMQQIQQMANPERRDFKINSKCNFLFILAICIAGIIAYSNSFNCSFHFDDKAFTAGTASIGDWLRLFPKRPIGILTFALNYYFHGLDVRGYHLVNLIIHLTNALLVWWLTWLTLSTPVMNNEEISRHKTMIAFLTGLLFVTHPLATQSVTYIVQRFASLATLFYLLSLTMFIRGKLESGDKKILWFFFGGSLICALLGMLTKEIVFTLPFAILLYDYCFFQTESWKLEIKDKSLIISFIMLAIFILLFFRNYSLTNLFDTVPPDQGYTYSISMKEYLFTQFSVILTYIRLFFLPVNQNLDYDYQLAKSFFQLKTFLSFSLLLGILATGVLLFKRYRLIAFGIFWFFLTISVESSIIPISQNVIFEHRTYLPGVGFFLALTGTFFYFFRGKYLKFAVIILLLIAAINTALTYQRNKIWQNDYTLWSDCVKKSPHKARPHNGRGIAYAEQGQYQLAIDDYNQAIGIIQDHVLPIHKTGNTSGEADQRQRALKNYRGAIQKRSDLVNTYYNRGFAYDNLGQHQRAIEDYNESIRLKPDDADHYNKRGAAYANIGQYQQAIEDYNEAIRLKPDLIEAYNNRVFAYTKLGKQQPAAEAVDYYTEIIRTTPDSATAYSNRGNAYTELGQHQLAIGDYSEAIRRKPDFAEYHYNRGTAYAESGQYQMAIEDFNKAISLKKDYVDAYNNKGIACAQLNQYQLAIENLNEAIRLKPDFANAYFNRANIYLNQGNKKLGCLDAQKACALGNCKLLDTGYCR